MDERVVGVLRALEARSRSEQSEREALALQGGSALRDRAGSFMLDVGPEVGLLLNILARAMGAVTIVEVGGSAGYSTVWLAEAARATGGIVHSIEVDAGKQQEQRVTLEAAGLESVVRQTSLEAHDLVSSLSTPIDLVLLDHWKELYVRDFDACWSSMRTGGVVVADNIIRPVKNAELIARYREHVMGLADTRTMTVAVGSGVEITTRT